MLPVPFRQYDSPTPKKPRVILLSKITSGVAHAAPDGKTRWRTQMPLADGIVAPHDLCHDLCRNATLASRLASC